MSMTKKACVTNRNYIVNNLNLKTSLNFNLSLSFPSHPNVESILVLLFIDYYYLKI